MNHISNQIPCINVWRNPYECNEYHSKCNTKCNKCYDNFNHCKKMKCKKLKVKNEM